LEKIELPDSIEIIANDIFFIDAELMCGEGSYVHRRAAELEAEVTLISNRGE